MALRLDVVKDTTMRFVIRGLDPALFTSLSGLDDDALRARQVVRTQVDAEPGYPCRITLQDAPVGARVLLLSHRHLDAASPYAQAGPIFVTETVAGQSPVQGVFVDAVPPALARRQLSVRGFDADGMMLDARITPGSDLPGVIEELFGNPLIAFIQAHNAVRGCFAATISRS